MSLKIGSLILACLAVSLSADTGAPRGGDMAIGLDARTGRPNVFIAWRNSQRILEVEVEVKNLGADQASAQLTLAILDEDGHVLASNTRPQDPLQRIELPARAHGGAEGRIVQVKGNLELNLLIDRLDRANAPYLLRAELVPDGPDTEVANNAVVKVFNLPSRVRAGATHFREFRFRNDSGAPIDVAWTIESRALPRDWTLTSSIAPGQRMPLAAGAQSSGWMQLAIPASVADGVSADLVAVARDARTGKVLYQHEWYAVNDLTPPRVTEFAQKLDPATGLLELTATVDDGDSMLKEASGVRVEYSTDRGVTFSSRTMAYSAGNFVGPTSFSSQLGPFAPGAAIVGRIVASDIADNRAEREFGPIVVTPPTGAPGTSSVDAAVRPR